MTQPSKPLVINSIEASWTPWDEEEPPRPPQSPEEEETDAARYLRHARALNDINQDRPEPQAAAPERTAAQETAQGYAGSRDDADSADTHDLVDLAKLVDTTDDNPLLTCVAGSAGDAGYAGSRDDADSADTAKLADDDPWDPPPLSAEAIVAHQRLDREQDACAPDRDDFLYRSWQHSNLYSQPVPTPPSRKPPARVTRVRDVTRDFCTVEEMAHETHWSRTTIREWFLEHPGDCQVVRHPETMHKRGYNSLRISPGARAAFYAAHAA
jgi:hypothetical protein